MNCSLADPRYSFRFFKFLQLHLSKPIDILDYSRCNFLCKVSTLTVATVSWKKGAWFKGDSVIKHLLKTVVPAVGSLSVTVQLFSTTCSLNSTWKCFMLHTLTHSYSCLLLFSWQTGIVLLELSISYNLFWPFCFDSLLNSCAQRSQEKCPSVIINIILALCYLQFLKGLFHCFS